MIDAHHHFWQYNTRDFAWLDDNMAKIRRDFLPNDFAPILQKHGFEGSVLVQVNQNEEENRQFLNYAEENPYIKGVVGWIDLLAPDLVEKLMAYQKIKKLKGFRHILQAEKDTFMLNPPFVLGLKLLAKYNFTYDLLIFENQLKSAYHLLKQLPENKIIIDHIAKPNIKNKSIGKWSNYLKNIAQLPNIYIKVSGMVTEADWQHWQKEDFYIYLDYVLAYFGTDRIVYGSDWPVCLVAAAYQEQLAIVQTYFSKLSTSEQTKIFGQNAIDFYKL